jgi:hypothetical protein
VGGSRALVPCRGRAGLLQVVRFRYARLSPHGFASFTDFHWNEYSARNTG